MDELQEIENSSHQGGQELTEEHLAAISSDSGSSYDENDDDPRFAIFNRNRLLGKKKRAKQHHTT